jgi:hypothetical protein
MTRSRLFEWVTSAIVVVFSFAIPMCYGMEAVVPEQAIWKPAPVDTNFTIKITKPGALKDSAEERTLTIKAVNNSSVVFISSLGGTREFVGFSLLMSDKIVLDDKNKEILAGLWPLQVGKKVNYTYTEKEEKGTILGISSAAEVLRTEIITVPAGTFKTFVIRTTANRSRRSSATRTVWYSSEIGWYAKQHWEFIGGNKRTDETSELISVKSGTPSVENVK